MSHKYYHDAAVLGVEEIRIHISKNSVYISGVSTKPRLFSDVIETLKEKLNLTLSDDDGELKVLINLKKSMVSIDYESKSARQSFHTVMRLQEWAALVPI